jgi:O-antigen/teichoic acid export membrane protein
MRLNNKTSVILVYISKVVNSILHFLITWVVTRKIADTTTFGKYSYVLTITAYIAVFFGFGFNDGLMNLVVNYKDEAKSRELCGLGFLINAVFSILYSITVFIYGILDKGVALNFFIIIFSQSIIMNDLLNRMSISQKRTDLILLNNFLIYSTILLLYILIDTNYINYLAMYFLIFFIYTNLLYFIGLKPKFNNLKKNYQELLGRVKDYGFNVYIGRMASMSTYDLDKLMLRAFSPIEYVGFYNLGLSCTSPITMFSDSIMCILFKDMADEDKIKKKVIVVNTTWLFVVSILFATVGKWIFPMIFSAKYKYVADCFVELGILAFFRGLYVPYNNFLAVKGYGKYMRNTAFILTGADIVFNSLLIPKYQMKGAIWATIISLIADNIAHYYYYKKAVKDIKKKKEENKLSKLAEVTI